MTRKDLINTNIIEEYKNGMTSIQLAEKYGLSKPTILKFLRENGVDTTKANQGYSNSKYTLNEHWLDNIDCQEKAYFLGFFYADGNVEALGKSHSYSRRMKLQVQDKYMLEKFAELFGSNRPILYEKRFDKRRSKPQESYVFRIGNKYLWEKIQFLGCPPNKTLIIKFPNFIPLNLMSHFIRGYFDGDGGISLRNNGTLANIRICGTEDMVKGLYNQVKSFTNVEGSYYKDKNGKNMWLYDIANQRDVKAFCDWIYHNSTIHLIRKYEEYVTFINTRDFSKQTWSDVNKRIHNHVQEIIKAYVEDKISILQLSKQYECSPPTINRLLRENNITIRNTRNQ